MKKLNKIQKRILKAITNDKNKVVKEKNKIVFKKDVNLILNKYPLIVNAFTKNDKTKVDTVNINNLIDEIIDIANIVDRDILTLVLRDIVYSNNKSNEELIFLSLVDILRGNPFWSAHWKENSKYRR